MVYWPPLQSDFKMAALTAGELVLRIALNTIVCWAVEAQKLLSQSRKKIQGSRGIASDRVCSDE